MKKSQLLPLAAYPDILTVRQTQEILGIGRIGVYKLLEAGALQGFRLGHTYKIPKSALLDYLASQPLTAVERGKKHDRQSAN